MIRKSKFPAPYKKGYFKVSGGHELYYELYGNPKGVPVLFFHGGPGGGFSDKHKTSFNPKKHNVLFFDQRGSGKSKPFASIENNTTQDLISDAKKLLDFVGFKKVYVFGGSWGSTLALLFAIEYPKLVTGLLLRGIFLASKDEMVSYYYPGPAVKFFFPEVWERFISLVPENKRSKTVEYYLEKMLNGPDREKYLYEWCLYESCVMSIDYDLEKTEKEIKQDKTYEAVSILEAHYFVNNSFLEDNFILQNAKKLKNIPTVIVQGRYDVVCPPFYAHKLKQQMPHAKLLFVKAGHASSDRAIKKKLIEEMEKIS
jgi:proline iminopeptidase